MVTAVNVGEGLTAYVDLLGAFSGLSLALHLANIFLVNAFLGYFTKVLVDVYRGVMKCREGRILLLNAIIIILWDELRNVAFEESYYPFG